MRTVDVTPPIVAGKNNESTARSPLTVKALPRNSKKLEVALLPSKTADPDICPLSFSFNISPTDTVPSATCSPPTEPPCKDRAEAVTIP